MYILTITNICFLALSASLSPFFNLYPPFLGSLGYNNRVMGHLCPLAAMGSKVSRKA